MQTRPRSVGERHTPLPLTNQGAITLNIGKIRRRSHARPRASHVWPKSTADRNRSVLFGRWRRRRWWSCRRPGCLPGTKFRGGNSDNRRLRAGLGTNRWWRIAAAIERMVGLPWTLIGVLQLPGRRRLLLRSLRWGRSLPWWGCLSRWWCWGRRRRRLALSDRRPWCGRRRGLRLCLLLLLTPCHSGRADNES